MITSNLLGAQHDGDPALRNSQQIHLDITYIDIILEAVSAFTWDISLSGECCRFLDANISYLAKSLVPHNIPVHVGPTPA